MIAIWNRFTGDSLLFNLPVKFACLINLPKSSGY